MSYASLLTKTLTHWAAASNDGFGGMTHSTPSQILGRWQNEVDTFQDAEGEEFISQAVVYTTTLLDENDWLYEGTSAQANPQAQQNAYRIRRLMKSESPDGSTIVYKYVMG